MKNFNPHHALMAMALVFVCGTRCDASERLFFTKTALSKGERGEATKSKPSLAFDFYNGDKSALTESDKSARAIDMGMEAQRLPNFSGKKIGEQALRFLGVPYRWGGANERTGMDCSGFALRAYQLSSGFLLPRVAREMARKLAVVSKKEMRTGDLVFFKTTGQFSHVGVYMGSGYFAHSPRSGSVARVDTLSKGYWRLRFEGARRPAQSNRQRKAFKAAESELASIHMAGAQ